MRQLTWNAALDGYLAFWILMTYWLILVSGLIAVLSATLMNKYVSRSGRFLGLISGLLAIAGLFDVAGEALGVHGIHATTNLSTDTAIHLCLVGVLFYYISMFTNFLTTPEMQAARLHDREAAAEKDRTDAHFEDQGKLVNVRGTAIKSFWTGTERFSEIETTDAVIVVDGEVGSIEKGVSVFANQNGLVRVAGRTFRKR